MGPYTPSLGDGRSGDTMFDVDAHIPSYVHGKADNNVIDQQEQLENASDIADLRAGLQQKPKHIPCGYLYNDRGSQLYEEITKLKQYYPFQTEKDLLSQHAMQIVSSIPAGSIIVELGCGNAEKTSVLLHALISRYNFCMHQISACLSMQGHAVTNVLCAVLHLHACMHANRPTM